MADWSPAKMLSLMNRTAPSHIITLTPPVCRLLAVIQMP